MHTTGWILALMQQAEAGAAAGGISRSLFDFAPLAMMLGVMYVLILRPSMKQKREHGDFLRNLKVDDEVATDSGLWGRVVQVEERVVTLEIADKVRVRVLRGRVQGSWAAASGAAARAAAAPAARATPPRAAATR